MVTAGGEIKRHVARAVAKSCFNSFCRLGPNLKRDYNFLSVVRVILISLTLYKVLTPTNRDGLAVQSFPLTGERRIRR
jgi:hypothetical protein